MKETGKLHTSTLALALFKITEAAELIHDEARRIRLGYNETPERIEGISDSLMKTVEELKSVVGDLKHRINISDRLY